MIDVGMGQKQIVYCADRNRKLIKGQLRVIAIGRAAVYQDIYAIG